MRFENRAQNSLWFGITLPLLLACSLLAAPTLVPPTKTAIPPTPTIIPSTPTTIPPTVISLAGQTDAFAKPILQAIADRQPDFEDDFSTTKKGWDWKLFPEGHNGTFVIEDGVARIRVGKAYAFLLHDALDQQDFVLQLDARLTAGDEASLMQVFIHNQSQDYWFDLNLYSELRSWQVDKMWDAQGYTLASGSGNVAPIGEFTRVMIVARGAQAAIYLNDVPVAYFEDAGFNTSGKTLLMCTSTSTPQTVCEFDNVKSWNLAEVPGLP